MLEGLPSLANHLLDLVSRKRCCGSLALVTYHLLGDVENAAEQAMTHYFPLTLAEPFLQSSSLGTPYQKWARFTNDDFGTLDQCVRRLIPAAWRLYEETMDRPGGDPSAKDAWHWFHTVNTEYASCVVSQDEPSLTLSTVNLRGWVDLEGSTFLNLVNRPDEPQSLPPIVTTSVRDISDRAVIAELYAIGLARVEEIRALNRRLVEWLRTRCTMEEITARHRGTLSDCWLG